jgi:hypothetical protein
MQLGGRHQELTYTQTRHHEVPAPTRKPGARSWGTGGTRTRLPRHAARRSLPASTPSSRSAWCCCWRSRGTGTHIPRVMPEHQCSAPSDAGAGGMRRHEVAQPSTAVDLMRALRPSCYAPPRVRPIRTVCVEKTTAVMLGKKTRPATSSARTADGDLCMRYNGLYFHLSDDCV